MTANAPSSVTQSGSGTRDLDSQARHAADGELSARFQSDVIPLLEPVYQHAMRMTRNHADAEDLLQETMVNADAGFRAFEPGGNLAAWLHQILINTHISSNRKQQCRPAQCPIDDITGAQLANTPHLASGLRSAEEQALERLGDNQIRAALQALPEQFRLAVYYADVEGFRSNEIADLTRTPVGTVTSRLHRGRRLLADRAQQRGYIAVAQPA
jgi:RNA polymerase sigma-70 factor (ECF subfamily)